MGHIIALTYINTLYQNFSDLNEIHSICIFVIKGSYPEITLWEINIRYCVIESYFCPITE